LTAIQQRPCRLTRAPGGAERLETIAAPRKNPQRPQKFAVTQVERSPRADSFRENRPRRAGTPVAPSKAFASTFPIFVRFDMAVRHIVRASQATAIVMALAAAGALASQGAVPPLAMNTARVSIAGTSNIHEYTASTTALRVTNAQLASSVSDANFWDDVIKPGGLESFEVVISSATLTSPREGLDKNMHKALKVEQFPDITFRLLRVEPDGAGIKAAGTLAIAGVERQVTLPIGLERTESGLSIKGQLPLLMTDYGIAAPKAMLGMLKTDPKVTVAFEAVLTRATLTATHR
jgi:polyisoprenoid-binding protein YceI